MSVYLINEYIYEDDLQLGKLKENCLLLKLYRKLRKSKQFSFNLPICKSSSYISSSYITSFQPEYSIKLCPIDHLFALGIYLLIFSGTVSVYKSLQIHLSTSYSLFITRELSLTTINCYTDN